MPSFIILGYVQQSLGRGGSGGGASGSFCPPPPPIREQPILNRVKVFDKNMLVWLHFMFLMKI